MAPGDVCHAPRCSLAGLGPVALGYGSCHCPGGSAGLPQRVRPMGCWLFPVPRTPYVCAVSWNTWLPFTGVPARCVALHLWCPGPLGSCSLVCPRGLSHCVSGVLGHLVPVHRCARSVCCVVCGVTWARWLLFTGVPARCAASGVRCHQPFGSWSSVCQAVVSRPFVVLGACAYAVSWPTWRLFTGVPSVCGACVPLMVVPFFLPPNIFFCALFLFFFKK